MNAFVRVVERGSFAAAATDLGLTPSALSKLVTRIEDRLGVRLLTRTTRKLALTDEGELFVARSREILASIEAAEAEVTAASEQPRGHLRISVGTALAKQILGLRFQPFSPAIPISASSSMFRTGKSIWSQTRSTWRSAPGRWATQRWWRASSPKQRASSAPARSI